MFFEYVNQVEINIIVNIVYNLKILFSFIYFINSKLIEDHIYLKNTPLQRIEIGIFNNYVNATYSNQTPLCEFKYFLPLFLDFLVQGTNNFLSENYFFQRISAYSLGDWTIGELTFLQQFAETYIHYHLYQEENAEFKYIEIFRKSWCFIYIYSL